MNKQTSKWMFIQRNRLNFSLWLVLFVVFLDHVGIGLVYPMFSSMLFEPDSPFIDSGASNAIKGWYLGAMLSAMPFAAFFSGPILGTLSDQKGRRPLFLFCLILAIVGYVCSVIGVIANSLIILIGSRIIVGLADGSMGVVSAAIADLSPNDSTKAKNFGLYAMVSGVGFALGPVLGGILSAYGFTIPFLFAGLATLLNLFLIWMYFNETHTVRKSAVIRFADGIRNLKKAFLIQPLRVLFLVSVFFCVGWSFFYEFLPVIWISDYGFNPMQVGFFFAYGSGFYALSSGVLIRPIVSRCKPYRVLFYSLCALGCVTILLLFHPGAIWIWIYLPIVNFLVALIWPTYTTMISDWAGRDAQGEILGISGSLQALAFAISPLAGGFLVGANTHMPMFVGGLSMLFAALFIWILLRRKLFY
jgi:DHA1 family tetracycline resistance protein-like MFS transporter